MFTVKIDNTLPPIGNTTATPAVGGPKPAVAAPSFQAGAGAERIDISALSARLQESVAGEAPFDAQKVAEIKQAIAEGRFQIDAQRIANSLIDSVRESLARHR